jgi:hypothetical protein
MHHCSNWSEIDPELTTAVTWLAFLTALGTVIALDIGYSPQIIIIIIIISCGVMQYTQTEKLQQIVTKNVRKNLEATPGKHSIDSLQKTAVLGTSHIMRKVLQCEI